MSDGNASEPGSIPPPGSMRREGVPEPEASKILAALPAGIPPHLTGESNAGNYAAAKAATPGLTVSPEILADNARPTPTVPVTTGPAPHEPSRQQRAEQAPREIDPTTLDQTSIPAVRPGSHRSLARPVELRVYQRAIWKCGSRLIRRVMHLPHHPREGDVIVDGGESYRLSRVIFHYRGGHHVAQVIAPQPNFTTEQFDAWMAANDWHEVTRDEATADGMGWL